MARPMSFGVQLNVTARAWRGVDLLGVASWSGWGQVGAFVATLCGWRSVVPSGWGSLVGSLGDAARPGCDRLVGPLGLVGLAGNGSLRVARGRWRRIGGSRSPGGCCWVAVAHVRIVGREWVGSWVGAFRVGAFRVGSLVRLS